MDLVISGDVFRPGQEINILKLYARINDSVREAFGLTPRLDLGPGPLPFEAWAKGDNPYPVTADLVIGFELPWERQDLDSWWIDVRRHPIRFVGEYYSLVSNIPGLDEIIKPFEMPVHKEDEFPKFSTLKELPVTGAFALQVHNDASLLCTAYDAFLAPWYYEEEILGWAASCDSIRICPHPQEPVSPWIPYLEYLLPEAVVREPGIYGHLRYCQKMIGISSSSCIEAPYFNCQPTTLFAVPTHGVPINLDDKIMWWQIACHIRNYLNGGK